LMRLRGQRIRLRHVREMDKRLLWEWANDPDVREVSFSVEPIPWERHRQWFDSKLNDPQCVFLIAINAEEQPVGQVRYEISGPDAVVSMSLDTKFRGQGYGRMMLASASRKLFRNSQAQVIHAFVKPENHVSVNAFLKAGFTDLGLTGMNGQEAIHLVLSREAMR